MHHSHNLSAVKRLAMLLLISAVPVQAATTAQQPIYIESDTLRIDEKKGLSHYQGHVKFKQESLIISADSIKVFTKNNKLDKVLIFGKPAHLKQQVKDQRQAITATAKRIEVMGNTEILHLYGDALIIQGQQRFSGEHIQYNSQTAQVTAQGAGLSTTPQAMTNELKPEQQGRVKAIITPKRDSTAP